MRKFVQRAVMYVTLGVIGTIVVAVVGEFFIELARERGWYDSPSQRVDAFLSAFSVFVTQVWLLCLASGLAGLTIGLWTDKFLRKHDSTERIVPVSKEVLAQARDKITGEAERKAEARRNLARKLDDLVVDGVKRRNELSRKIFRDPLVDRL